MTVFKVSDSFKLQGWWYVLLGPWTFKVVVVTLLVGVDSRTAIGQSCGNGQSYRWKMGWFGTRVNMFHSTTFVVKVLTIVFSLWLMTALSPRG